MSWHIDSEGIHIDASCLEVIHSDLKEIEWRLKCEPRTVAEENAMNMDAFRAMLGGSFEAPNIDVRRRVPRYVHS